MAKIVMLATEPGKRGQQAAVEMGMYWFTKLILALATCTPVVIFIGFPRIISRDVVMLPLIIRNPENMPG